MTVSRKKAAYHAAEAKRIQGELDSLGDQFADDGIVKWVLRRRIEQEKKRAGEKARFST